jgi:hypothetical protein
MASAPPSRFIPTGSVVGKRQTGADPHRRTWEQHDESLEAFEKRVEAEAEALRAGSSASQFL